MAELLERVLLLTVSVPVVVDAAAVIGRHVVGEGGVSDRQRAIVEDAAADARRPTARDR